MRNLICIIYINILEQATNINQSSSVERLDGLNKGKIFFILVFTKKKGFYK